MPFVFCFKIFVLNFMLLNPQPWRPKLPSYPKEAAQARQEQVSSQRGGSPHSAGGSTSTFPCNFRLWRIFSPQLLWLNYQWTQWKPNAFLRQGFSHPLGTGGLKKTTYFTHVLSRSCQMGTAYCEMFLSWERIFTNIHSRTKQNLSTSLTLKTKSPLAKSLKVVHHPQLTWDPGCNKVQELLPSRGGNEIPSRCGPGVKR